MECLEGFNGSGGCFGACVHKPSGFPVGVSFTSYMSTGSCTIERLLF